MRDADTPSCTTAQTLEGVPAGDASELTSSSTHAAFSCQSYTCNAAEQALEAHEVQSNHYGQVFRNYTNLGQWGRGAVETNYFLNHKFQVRHL